jgi:hypothetical protein
MYVYIYIIIYVCVCTYVHMYIYIPFYWQKDVYCYFLALLYVMRFAENTVPHMSMDWYELKAMGLFWSTDVQVSNITFPTNQNGWIGGWPFMNSTAILMWTYGWFWPISGTQTSHNMYHRQMYIHIWYIHIYI